VLATIQQERHDREVGEEAAGAQDRRGAQPHHVAEAEDEGDRVEVEDDARALGESPDRGNELEGDELAPDLEGRDEEVIDAGDEGGLQQQARLRASLLAGHQDLGDRRCLGVGELAVHLAHEVAAQRDEE